MAGAVRVISFADLRDGLDQLTTIKLSDQELADRGIPLTKRETLVDGLGPSTYTLIELASGHQYLLHRLEHKPETLNVDGPLSGDLQSLIEQFLAALDIRKGRVVWSASEEFWNQSRQGYDRDEWLRRFKGHS